MTLGVDAVRFDLGEILPVEFMEELKEIQEEFPNVLFANERWGFATDNTCNVKYIDTVDTVMNYPLLDAIARWTVYGNHAHFRYMEEREALYPACVKNVLLNFLDTHDTPRAINMYSGIGMNQDPLSGGYIGDIERRWRPEDFTTLVFRGWENDNDVPYNIVLAKKRVKLASAMMYMEQGIPFILYGTEAGLTGNKDPFNRKPYPYGKEDKDLLNYFSSIGAMRKANRDILADGINLTPRITEDIAIKLRSNEHGRMIGIFNRSDHIVDLRALAYANLNHYKIMEINDVSDNKLGACSGIIARVE